MKTLLISWIPLFFFLCSCSTTKKLPVEDYTKLDETNINLINGSYTLKDSIDYIFCLEVLLAEYYKNKGNMVIGDKLVIQVIDKNHFKIKLLKQDLVLREKEFRSKFKRGYVNFRNKEINGSPLAWAVISSNNLMYLTKNGLRIMQYRSNSSFFFFFFPFNSVSWEENMLFQKID